MAAIGSSDCERQISGVPVAEIEADCTVTASEPGVFEVRAALREVDDGSFLCCDPIALSGNEKVRAVFGGRKKVLKRDGAAVDPEYVRTFRPGLAEGPVEIRFRRNGGRVFSNTVTLRPEFTVTEPADGHLTTFDDTLFLTWTPAQPGQTMHLGFYLACTTLGGRTSGRLFFGNTPDDGSDSLDLSTLSEATNPSLDPSQDCMMDIDFVRSSSTDITPPYGSGSSLVAGQIRTVSSVMIGF